LTVVSEGSGTAERVDTGVVNAGVCVCDTVGVAELDSRGSELVTGPSKELSPPKTPPRMAGASRPSNHSSRGVKVRVATVPTSLLIKDGPAGYGAATADQSRERTGNGDVSRQYGQAGSFMVAGTPVPVKQNVQPNRHP